MTLGRQAWKMRLTRSKPIWKIPQKFSALQPIKRIHNNMRCIHLWFRSYITADRSGMKPENHSICVKVPKYGRAKKFTIGDVAVSLRLFPFLLWWHGGTCYWIHFLCRWQWHANVFLQVLSAWNVVQLCQLSCLFWIGGFSLHHANALSESSGLSGLEMYVGSWCTYASVSVLLFQLQWLHLFFIAYERVSISSSQGTHPFQRLPLSRLI